MQIGALLAAVLPLADFVSTNPKITEFASGKGYHGGDALVIRGDSKQNLSGGWMLNGVEYQPDTWYCADFMINRERGGSEIIFENAFAWTIYSSYLRLDWQNIRLVFRSYGGTEPIRDVFKVWEYKPQQRTSFSDIRLYPVKPVWRMRDGLELGDGEYVSGNEYFFNNDTKNETCCCQRPFLGSTKGARTGFKYDATGEGSYLYRFNVNGRRLLAATALVAPVWAPGGTKVIEVSADEGVTWQSVARVTNCIPCEVRLPSSLFPCEAIRLRYHGVGDAKTRTQFRHVSFRARFDGSPVARCAGTTRIVNCETGETVLEAKARTYREETFGARLPASTEELGVWVASSGCKVMRDAPVPEKKTAAIRVATAANEAESVQVVFNPTRTIPDLRLEVESFDLPKDTVTILREHYLDVKMVTDAQGTIGWWPDALPEQDARPYTAEAGQATPFFVRVKPPRGTKKGVYRGVLRAGDVRLPLEVEVFGFEFPDRVTVKTPFGFHEKEVFRYHKVTEEADKELLREKYYQLLSDSHITPYPLTTVEPKLTFRNQRDPEKAEVTIDWTAFDRAIAKYWSNYNFNIFRVNPIGIGSSNHDIYHEPIIAGVRRGDPSYERLMHLYLGQIQRHLEEKGMIDYVYVNPYDEPYADMYDYVNWQCALFKRHAPKIPTLITCVEGANRALRNVDIWQPVPHHLHTPDLQFCRDRGDRFWWYICCSPPGVCVGEHIDHPGLDQRLWLWQTWAEEIAGVLVWDVGWWNGRERYPNPDHMQDPWEDPAGWGKSVKSGLQGCAHFQWCNGEGRYLYPPLAARNGRQAGKVLDGPVSSYRLELLREGIEDYEYFSLLKKLDPNSPLLKVPESVSRSVNEYSTAPDALESHRMLLAREIERLSVQRQRACAKRWESVLERPSPAAYPSSVTGAVESVMLDGVDCAGKPTRFFAWCGLPKGADAAHKVPAMVLVHGGDGTAYDWWVKLWNDRGYAAIAMDTCGAVPVMDPQTKHWSRHAFSGPAGWGGFDTIGTQPETDQWTYHAVADVLLAHSFLRSLPGVDPERIGLTGISWGGYLTCIAAGVDPRFKWAMPVYGCGFYADGSEWAPQLRRMGARGEAWMKTWDASVYLSGATCPFLWVSGTTDRFFKPLMLQKSAACVRGKSYFRIQPEMIHGHKTGSRQEELFAFADHFAFGTPMPSTVSEQWEVSDRQLTVTGAVSEAKWVFAGESLDDLPTNACLRLCFDVDRPVKRAWVHSFRERCWGVWLNGKPLNCTLWPAFKSYSGHVRGTGAEIGPLLKPGRNVLAIGCARRAPADRPKTRTCGVMLRGEIEFADGTHRTLLSTSRQIKASPEVVAGWQNVDFDDSHWPAGLEIGDATALPWARYSDVMKQYASPEEYAAYQQFLKTGGGRFDEKALLAEPDSPNAKVVFSGRLPGIETNGKVIPPYAFMEIALVPSKQNDDVVLSAKKAGIPILGLSRFLRGKYEAEDGTYDFSQFDGGIRRILALYPEARFFLYYRNGAEMPVGWVEKHPDELVGYAIPMPGRKGFGDYSGNPPVPSFASKLYREEERRFWKAFGEYARSQPWGRRILGIHCGFGGSGDGMPAGCNKMPDTGKRMTEAFRRYLTAKYPTDAALQTAWGDQTVTRATAAVPDRTARQGTGLFVRDLADPRDRRVNDYYECYTRELEDFMLAFGRSIKEALPGCLAGTYFGYTILPYTPEGVTARYDRLLKSPDIDYFYATTLGYNLSDGFHRGLHELCRRSGKFCSIEGDVRPWNSRGFGGEEQWRSKTPEETRATFGKFVSNALVFGTGWQAVDFGPHQSGTGLWWHNCPEAMETMAAGVRTWKALWKNPGDAPNEIAVVFDPDSPWKNGHGDRDTTEVHVRNLVDFAIQSLTFTGYPFDLLSPSGYASSTAKYKAVVFLNTLTASADLDRAAAKVRADRATAVWCYAPSLGGPQGYDADAVRRLTGIGLSVKREPCTFEARGPGLHLFRFATPGSWKDAPRLFVEDASAETLASWTDDKTVAAASKRQADGSRSVFFGITPHESSVWAKLFKEAGAAPVTEPGFYVARAGNLLEVFSGKNATLHGGLAVQCGQVSQKGAVEVSVGSSTSEAVDVLTGEMFAAKDGTVVLKSSEPKTWLLQMKER